MIRAEFGRRPRGVGVVAAAGVVALLAAGCSSSAKAGGAGASSTAAGAPSSAASSTAAGGAGSSAAAGSVTVETRTGPMGTFLTDGAGRTLYLFAADKGSASACSGACAAAWPPLTVTGAPAAAGSARSGLLGTIHRAGGGEQVTYAGHPLYTYVADSAPGDTAGEGVSAFGAKWWLVAPSGRAITAASASKSTGYSGGGY